MIFHVPAQRKYRNTPTVIDGLRFASKAEAKRYTELRLLERTGHIHDLKVQPRYELAVNGTKVCTYVGDFAYLDGSGAPRTEDVKGVLTPEFKIKARLFRILMGREIQVIQT